MELYTTGAEFIAIQKPHIPEGYSEFKLNYEGILRTQAAYEAAEHPQEVQEMAACAKQLVEEYPDLFTHYKAEQAFLYQLRHLERLMDRSGFSGDFEAAEAHYNAHVAQHPQFDYLV